VGTRDGRCNDYDRPFSKDVAMELPAIGGKERKTLVLLGAGATRGASFVATDAAVTPPLDADFFQVLQMSETGRIGEARELLDHVRRVYGPGLDVGLETVFNNLDAARTFHDEFHVGRGRRLQQPGRLIDALRTVLPRLLGESISGPCAFHAILASHLRVGDAVISLNYDCVMDQALSHSAGFRFDPERGGYSLPVEAGAEQWRRAGRGRRPQGSILLLKLHGSLNWDGPDVPLRLRADPYQVVAENVIVPPLTNKPVTTEPFKSVWLEARRAVKSMRRLIVIGYSLPAADGLVRALLTTDLGPDLEEILVVDPSPATQTRHIEFFSRGAPDAKAFVFQTVRQFAQALS
jgi:hypothetical protein